MRNGGSERVVRAKKVSDCDTSQSTSSLVSLVGLFQGLCMRLSSGVWKRSWEATALNRLLERVTTEADGLGDANDTADETVCHRHPPVCVVSVDILLCRRRSDLSRFPNKLNHVKSASQLLRMWRKRVEKTYDFGTLSFWPRAALVSLCSTSGYEFTWLHVTVRVESGRLHLVCYRVRDGWMLEKNKKNSHPCD